MSWYFENDLGSSFPLRPPSSDPDLTNIFGIFQKTGEGRQICQITEHNNNEYWQNIVAFPHSFVNTIQS